MVRNSTGHVIPEKTLIKLVLMTSAGKVRIQAAGAYRALARGDSIAVGSAAGIKSCIAKVTLQPNLKAKIDTKIGKLTR